MPLPRDVVRRDHQLEQAVESAGSSLASHRWHWTIDEQNPKRVSLGDYAKQVGRHKSTIHRYAQAHGLIVASLATGEPMTLTEAFERAGMSAETEAAVEAVANAHGVSIQTARRQRPTEVRRVRELAREAVEHGGDLADEAQKVADWAVKAQRAAKRTQDNRKQMATGRFFEMESHLDRARKQLLAALNLAHSIEWEDEHRELLTATVGNVKALLTLIDMALVGASDVDWDAELASLGGDR